MKVGIPRETAPGETRVALIPVSVPALKKAGLEVIVQEGAGAAAGFTDDEYRTQGAATGSRADVFGTADIILQVRSAPGEPGVLRN
ncbi:MAG: NAD(P)(+) transhydrogenase (Re/Si-specific) subunit alpha, partial [Acidobacteria bacterium]|nr:NAD(P)(+) transhydrogenase (Re/Si-specific) subunit alpha [Acidobacteriota bacterium]